MKQASTFNKAERSGLPPLGALLGASLCGGCGNNSAAPSVPEPKLRGARALSLAAALFSILLLCLLAPQEAEALWPVPGSGCVALGYEQTYVGATGAARVHHGVDCAAPAGAEVVSPAGGRVSFIGSVPAGEEPGSPTMIAVSVALGDGRTLTLMPFASVCVEEGQEVAAGLPLGTLAATGDASSAAPHLHVGLKDASRYYDPLALLGFAPGRGGAAYEAEAGKAALPLAALETGLSEAQPQPVAAGAPAEPAGAALLAAAYGAASSDAAAAALEAGDTIGHEAAAAPLGAGDPASAASINTPEAPSEAAASKSMQPEGSAQDAGARLVSADAATIAAWRASAADGEEEASAGGFSAWLAGVLASAPEMLAEGASALGSLPSWAWAAVVAAAAGPALAFFGRRAARSCKSTRKEHACSHGGKRRLRRVERVGAAFEAR